VVLLNCASDSWHGSAGEASVLFAFSVSPSHFVAFVGVVVVVPVQSEVQTPAALTDTLTLFTKEVLSGLVQSLLRTKPHPPIMTDCASAGVGRQNAAKPIDRQQTKTENLFIFSSLGNLLQQSEAHHVTLQNLSSSVLSAAYAQRAKPALAAEPLSAQNIRSSFLVCDYRGYFARVEHDHSGFIRRARRL
jgi:hypothetical protein